MNTETIRAILTGRATGQFDPWLSRDWQAGFFATLYRAIPIRWLKEVSERHIWHTIANQRVMTVHEAGQRRFYGAER